MKLLWLPSNNGAKCLVDIDKMYAITAYPFKDGDAAKRCLIKFVGHQGEDGVIIGIPLSELALMIGAT
jgi:hypothetical protein